MNRSRSLHPFCERLQAIIAIPLISCLLVPPSLLAQAAPTATVAPGAGNTRAYVVPGGTTVIDIATPNAAGLSQNRFTNYNVGGQGLVLNNAVPSQISTSSQLAGALMTNFNLLPTASAQVILNEVVSPNASTLAGFTEIAGAKADLVVANPYGITVNGAGFLNTREVTLATAHPNLDADGRLSFLRVTDGELLVTGQGLNASAVDYLALLGRSVRIDGQVNAPDLTVGGGAADYDPATRAFAAGAVSGSAPAYAIDSGILGGMYTNRIRLVANEGGVGVRMLGDVAATQEDFTIDAAGHVQLSGRAYAEQDLRVTARGVEVSGSDAALTAKRDLALAGGTGAVTLTDAGLVAGRDLAITGDSLADSSAAVPAEANRFAIGNVSINVANGATVSRSTYGAGGQVSAQAANIGLADLASIYSGADSSSSSRGISLSTTGGLDTGNAQITSTAGLTLSSQGALTIGASGTGTGLQAQGDAVLSAATALDNAGTVLANGALAIRSNHTASDLAITNSGRLQAAGEVSIAARDSAALVSPGITFDNTATGIVAGRTVDLRGTSLANAGRVQGTQDVTVAATGTLTTAAGSALMTSEAGRDITVTAGSLDTAGTVQSAGRITFTLDGDAANSGNILTLGADQGGAAGGITLNARTLDNSGTVQSAGTLALTAAGTETGIANSGTLQSAGAMTLSSGATFENAVGGRVLGGMDVTISDNGTALAVNNAGRLQAGQNVVLGTVAPVTFTQTAMGVTLAGGSLQVPLSSLDNAGIVQTGGTLALTTSGTIVNRAGGTILTAGAENLDVALGAASLSNAGTIQSTGALAIDVTGAFDNSGALLTLAADAGGAARGITLESDTFANTGRIQSADGLDLSVTNAVTSVTNSGTIVIADSLTFDLASDFINETSGIIAGGDLNLVNGGSGGFTVTNAGRLESEGDFIFGGSTRPVTLTNEQNAVMLAGGTLDLAASSLTNAGTVQSGGALTAAISGTFTNTADGEIITTGGDATVTSASLANTGTIQSGGALDLDATTTLDNSGLVATSGTGALAANAATLTNSGTVASGGTLALGATAALTNSGVAKSAGATTLTAPSLENATAGSVLSGGDLVVKSGGGGFSVSNAGQLESGADLTLGESAATAALTNAAGGTILAGGAAVLATATLVNSGTVQGGTALTVTSSGATTNAATGLILTAGTTPAPLSVTADTVENSGVIQSNHTLALTTPNGLTNAAGAKIVGVDTVALQSGAAGFDVTNAGTVESGSTMTVGTAAAPVEFINQEAGRILSAADLTVEASTAENAGVIQSAGALTLNAAGSFTNSAGGSVATTGTGSALSIAAASMTNTGAAQSAGALTLDTTGTLTNSGTLVTSGTAGFTATANTIDNSGTVQAGGTLDVTTTQTSGTTLANRGTIFSTANMTLTTPGTMDNAAAGTIASDGLLTVNAGSAAFTVLNSGALRAAQDLNLGATASRVALTNASSGTIDAGGAFNLMASTVSNSGLLQSAGTTTVDATDAVSNDDGARVLVTGVSPAALILAGASLTNAGTLQSTGAITTTTTGSTTNTGTIFGSGTDAIALTAGTTFTQDGTITTDGNLTLTTDTDYTGAADSSAISGGTLELTGSAGFTATNSGLLQSAGAMTIGATDARVALTNNSAGNIQADDLTVHAAGATNSGLLQAQDELVLTMADGGTVTNQSGAKVQAGGDLTLSTPGTSFNLTNAGTLQAAATTTLGAAGQVVAFTQQADGKLITDALVVRAGAIDNSGSITTSGSTDISASSFYNRGSAAKLVAGAGTGTTTLSATGAITNEGTLFAANAFSVSAASLTVSSTGALASQGDLTVTTSGDLTNDGALYTASHLTTNAGGTILVGASGTIDTDGNFTATAGTFRNRGQVNIGGIGDISATTFENVYASQPAGKIVVGPPRPTAGHQGFASPVQSFPTSGETDANKLTAYFIQNVALRSISGATVSPWGDLAFADSDIVWYETERFVDANGNVVDPSSISSATRPQIAASNLTIRNFNSGTNSGLISTPGTLQITGNGGSSFTNNALTLTESKYHARTNTSLGNTPDAPPRLIGGFFLSNFNTSSYNGWVFGNGGGSGVVDPLGTTTIYSNGAGIRAGNLVVQNVASLSNLGSPFGAATDSVSASGDGSGALVGATAAGTSAVGGTTFAPVDSVDDLALVSATALVAGSTPGTSGETTLASGKTAGDAGMASSVALISAAAAFTAPAGKVLLSSLRLSLPTNPNGFFVVNRDPSARFKVTLNVDLGISADAVGSDYLARELGYDADQIEKRLGDPAYETYLVRQQLVDQLGTRLLAGQASETAQMQALMSAGADSARKLGLAWGAAPTSAQLDALDADIVWMVAQVVDGEQVLTPQVYLSPKTRSMFDGSNATIAATGSATISVGDLANKGGAISGDRLAIDAAGDVTNISGTISGRNVDVKAGGSIINETVTSDQGRPGEKHDFMQTSIGRTATIAATGDLSLDAGRDIFVKGGDITAGGDGAMRAGGDITVQTITDTTAHTTQSESGNMFQGSTTRTTVTDVKNIASNINFGGNATVASGGDMTLLGSNFTVGENLKADVKGDFTVQDVHDIHTVDTVTSQSGMGVGGGIYGTRKTTSNDFTGTSRGSSIQVGGNADVTAGRDVTLAGSQMNVDGDAALNATNINIIDGHDVHTNVTKVETTTFGVFSGSGSSTGASASGIPGRASASASAGGSGEVTIGVRTSTEVTRTGASTSQGSTLEVGGNARLGAREDIAVRGSDVAAGGDLDLTARDIIVVAGQDVDSRSYDSTTTTSGLSFTGSGSASADAGARGGLGAAGSGSAQAGGEVGVGVKTETSTTAESGTSTTARVSTLTSGRNMTRTAENRITDVGTTIDVGGDLTQQAREIESLAAANTTSSDFTTSTETVRVGLYAEGSAGAETTANTGGQAKAEAGASVSAGIKASFSTSTETGSERTSEAVVSTIRTGGGLTSVSTGKTTFEGTAITTGGDARLEAESLDFRAAKNTADSTGSSNSLSVEAKIGYGAGGDTSGGGGKGVTGSMTAEGSTGSESSRESTAVTGSVATGGNLTVITRNDARFEGTALEGGNDTTIDAGGDVTFDAARNTLVAQSSEVTASAGFSASKGSGGKEAGASAEAGYSRESESSSEAVTGSVAAGNKLTIRSGGKATFEGTDLAAGGDADIGAKGDVEFKQATSTSSADSLELSAGIGLTKSSGKSDSGGKTTGSEQGASFGLGASSERESTAKVSAINTGGKLAISSGNDVTLQGTNIDAEGSVDVDATGNLKLTAAEESSSSTGVSLDVSATRGKETEDGETTRSKKGALGVSAGFGASSTETGGTIRSGGAVNLTSGKDTTLVGTQVGAQDDVNVTAGGAVVQQAAESSSSGGAIGLEVAGQSEKKTGGEDPDGGSASSSTAPMVTDVSVQSDRSKQQVNIQSTGDGKVTTKSGTPPPPKSDP